MCIWIRPTPPERESCCGWNDGSWEHRAYWGANVMCHGVDGTSEPALRWARCRPVGQWVRLAVPAAQVGLGGPHPQRHGLRVLYNGRATWDYAGKAAGAPATSYQISGTVTAGASALTAA